MLRFTGWLFKLVMMVVAFNACVLAGLTNDYNKLSREQQERIHNLHSFDEAEPGLIYKINATQLKEELQKHPKALIYVFNSGCGSDACGPLSNYEVFAANNNYRLFLVMTGYTDLEKTISQEVESPLYVIDSDHYGSRYQHVYYRHFTNELQNLPADASYKERKEAGNHYFFNSGKLVRLSSQLEEN
jgi:hypothetical protein